MQEKHMPNTINTVQPSQGGSAVENIASTKDTSLFIAQDSSANRLEPTRYGDWEMNGRCIDF